METLTEVLLKCPYCPRVPKSDVEFFFENMDAYLSHAALKHQIKFEDESPLDPIEVLKNEFKW